MDLEQEIERIAKAVSVGMRVNDALREMAAFTRKQALEEVKVKLDGELMVHDNPRGPYVGAYNDAIKDGLEIVRGLQKGEGATMSDPNRCISCAGANSSATEKLRGTCNSCQQKWATERAAAPLSAPLDMESPITDRPVYELPMPMDAESVAMRRKFADELSKLNKRAEVASSLQYPSFHDQFKSEHPEELAKAEKELAESEASSPSPTPNVCDTCGRAWESTGEWVKVTPDSMPNPGQKVLWVWNGHVQHVAAVWTGDKFAWPFPSPPEENRDE